MEHQVDFKRPETINRFPATPKTNYKLKNLSIIKDVLYAVGGYDLLERFYSGSLGHLVNLSPTQKCAMSMHHLISREIKKPGADEHEVWFHFNGVDARFSYMDYALVTGLKFGTSTFDPDATHDISGVQVYQHFCRPKILSDLVSIFANQRMRVEDEDGSLYLQAANVILLYSILFVYDERKKIAPWVWALVNNLDAFNAFPWGTVSFKVLLHYMANINTNKEYRFLGPAWAFYCWGLEVIPLLGQSVAHHDDQPIYPRCLRWRPHQKQLIPGCSTPPT